MLVHAMLLMHACMLAHTRTHTHTHSQTHEHIHVYVYTHDEEASSSCWCSTMVEARIGSRGRVVAWMIPRGRGEEEPRGAGAGLLDVGLALPGKAALT